MLINNDFSFSSTNGFIAIDGVNGAGKGTLIQHLLKHLQSLGIPVLTTREPGGSELGQKMRPLILGEKCQGLMTELFLFAADRNEHVCSVIRPALTKHQLVISDRYYYSTTAFQGYGRGLPLDRVNHINSLAVDGCLPDLFILLDLPPEIGLERTRLRNSQEYDKMEGEELAFHRRLREGFLEQAKICREPCLVVNASQSAETVWQTILPVINNFLRVWETK